MQIKESASPSGGREGTDGVEPKQTWQPMHLFPATQYARTCFQGGRRWVGRGTNRLIDVVMEENRKR
jgi:hypothetical protein